MQNLCKNIEISIWQNKISKKGNQKTRKGRFSPSGFILLFFGSISAQKSLQRAPHQKCFGKLWSRWLPWHFLKSVLPNPSECTFLLFLEIHPKVPNMTRKVFNTWKHNKKNSPTRPEKPPTLGPRVLARAVNVYVFCFCSRSPDQKPMCQSYPCRRRKKRF